MGEAKRRKQLDPNYGKVKTWQKNYLQLCLCDIPEEIKIERVHRVLKARDLGIDLTTDKNWIVFFPGDFSSRKETLKESLHTCGIFESLEHLTEYIQTEDVMTLDFAKMVKITSSFNYEAIFTHCLTYGGYDIFDNDEERSCIAEIEYRPDIELINP